MKSPGALAVLLGWVMLLVLPELLWSQEIPARLLQEDFQIMRHALEESHGGLYRYTSKADMDRTFERAFRKIDHPMSALEFWGLVVPVVAHIKDGHLFTLWPKDLLWRQVPLLPLTVRIFDSRLFVYRDYSSNARRLEGAQILSINGVSTKQLLKRMLPMYTGEGKSRTAAPYRLGHYGNFLVDLYALRIGSPFRIEYRDAIGKSDVTEIVGKPVDELQAASRARDPEPETTAELKFLDDGKIALLTIRSFERYVDEARKLELREFIRAALEQIHERGASSLILDLRDNSGGLDDPGAQLFSYLWDKPFEYYTDKTMNALEYDFFKYAPAAKPFPANLVEKRADGKYHFLKAPGLGLQQPSQPHFGGRVFALMNGGSFSTTCEFLSTLPLHRRGVLIGEEAAGGYYGCTAGFRQELVLPNSKVRLPLGMVTYYYAAAKYEHAARGMLPDYHVTHTIGDLIVGRDRDMETALALARGK